MAVGGTAGEERGLTKRVASAVTTGGPQPRAVRLGSRLHLWLLRHCGAAGFLGRDVLVLTTTGRRTGVPRSTPLYYVHRGDAADRKYWVAASFAGRNAPPAWYLNLIADPQVGVQVGGRRIACRARVLEPGEAQARVAAAGRDLPAVRPLSPARRAGDPGHRAVTGEPAWERRVRHRSTIRTAHAGAPDQPPSLNVA